MCELKIDPPCVPYKKSRKKPAIITSKGLENKRRNPRDKKAVIHHGA